MTGGLRRKPGGTLGRAALLDSLKARGAVVPPLRSLEVANVLLQAERRGWITMTTVDGRLAAFAALPITVDTTAWRSTGVAALALARLHGLTTYDAAYLELAIRQRLPLATKDKALGVQSRPSCGWPRGWR